MIPNISTPVFPYPALIFQEHIMNLMNYYEMIY